MRAASLVLAACAVLAGAAPAAARPFVVEHAGALDAAASAGADGTLAVAARIGAGWLRVTLRDPAGNVHRRTLPSRTGRVERILAATDGRGATTVVWQGHDLRGHRLVFAATLDRRGRFLARPARVALRPRMALFGLVAGRGRALLVTNVFDNLQATPSYCSFGSVAFAGDNYFGAVKTATGRFGTPASINTGDSYGGSGLLADGHALSADGYGDVDAWPQAAPNACTRWRSARLAGRKLMRSGTALAVASDGDVAWIGQRNRGYFVPTGDEDTGPPTPAAGELTGVLVPSNRFVGLGRGASPAVAAVAGGGAAFAWLDQPAPAGFGGRGRALPTAVWARRVRSGGGGGHAQRITGMFANPLVAAPPQVAAGGDGTVAVLEAASRYRLAVGHAGRSLSAARDAGDDSPVHHVEILSAGRAVYLVRQGLRATRITRL